MSVSKDFRLPEYPELEKLLHQEREYGEREWQKQNALKSIKQAREGFRYWANNVLPSHPDVIVAGRRFIEGIIGEEEFLRITGLDKK